MAKKEFKFEGRVSRGWGGVEEIQIAFGTDNIKELKDLVNQTAAAMQDRADEHQRQLRAVEEAMRANAEKLQAENEQEETDEIQEPTEQ